MQTVKHVIVATALTLCPIAALAAPAAGFGQPFLVIDADDAAGSILNFFGPFGPSDREDLSLSGTITTAIGAPSLVGAAFDFDSSENNEDFTLTLGSTSATEFFIDLDPFQAGPGDLNISLAIIPPFNEVDLGGGDYRFDYLGDFAEFPSQMNGTPEFEVKIAVFLDAALPTKFFDDGFGGVTYVEGPLGIDRIEFATAGGAPLPAAVPLPASGLLILAGLGGLTSLRKRRKA